MKKQFVCSLLIILLLCSILNSSTASDLSDTSEYHCYGCTYTLDDVGNATITRCYALEETTLTIPATLDGHPVTAISNLALAYINNDVTSITLPNSLTSIEDATFASCLALTTFQVSPDNPVLEAVDGVLFDKIEKKLICYPRGRWVTSYTVPQGTHIIGVYAFFCCRNLTNITLPDSIIQIGKSAFEECNYLQNITLPNGLAIIDDYAFFGCSEFTSITLPDSVTTVGINPFMICTQLSSFQASPSSASIEVIDGVLFDKREKRLLSYPCARAAESYTVPQGTRSINNGAFFGCSLLINVTLPDSLTSIGDDAFSHCTSLKDVTLPPNSVSGIGEGAFEKCEALTSITLPDSVTSIGSYAFAYCESLQSIYIPGSVTSIGNYAFAYCESLQSIHIPGSVTSIGYHAFRDCESLQSIYIPDSVIEIGIEAFIGCPLLTIDCGTNVFARKYADFYGLNAISDTSTLSQPDASSVDAMQGTSDTLPIDVTTLPGAQPEKTEAVVYPYGDNAGILSYRMGQTLLNAYPMWGEFKSTYVGYLENDADGYYGGASTGTQFPIGYVFSIQYAGSNNLYDYFGQDAFFDDSNGGLCGQFLLEDDDLPWSMQDVYDYDSWEQFALDVETYDTWQLRLESGACSYYDCIDDVTNTTDGCEPFLLFVYHWSGQSGETCVSANLVDVNYYINSTFGGGQDPFNRNCEINFLPTDDFTITTSDNIHYTVSGSLGVYSEQVQTADGMALAGLSISSKLDEIYCAPDAEDPTLHHIYTVRSIYASDEPTHVIGRAITRLRMMGTEYDTRYLVADAQAVAWEQDMVAQ